MDSTKMTSTANGVENYGVFRNNGTVQLKNLIVAGFKNGIYLATDSPGDAAVVVNSTIANSTGYGVYLATGTVTVTNTIVHGDSGTYGLAQVSGTLTHSHNLIHGFTAPFYGTSADATELLEKPRFVNVGLGNYQLDIGSPAINSGKDESLTVATDFNGASRPAFNVFEIGAFEFTSDNASFRVLRWEEKR